MINQRLFDHYKIDTKKNLQIKNICPRPYDTILIDKNGSCYACECTSWLPQSIGNLQLQNLSEITGSEIHNLLRESVSDETYRYCNEHQCSYIKSGAVLNDNTNKLRHLRLAIDDSCNLRCPSCRKGLIFHKNGSAFRLGIKLANKINNFLQQGINYDLFPTPITVHIGSDGDPFASHVYRHFMEQTPKSKMIRYSILTNALMFEDFHTKVPHIINSLDELGVSIDGASKETYEKLRLGGKWDNIHRNLKCIANLKQKHNFRFILHFVVQKDNYHEMEKIIDLGEQYGADRVWLNKIEDWGTIDDFKTQNIFETTDYKRQLDNVVQRIQKRNDRFIECPTLISEAVRYRTKK